MLHFVQGYLILFLHDPWGNVKYLLDKISFLLVWQIEANLFLLKLQDFYQKLADEKNICAIKLVQWVGKIIKILSCFKFICISLFCSCVRSWKSGSISRCVQLNRSASPHPESAMQLLTAFPSAPSGHSTSTDFPKLVLGHHTFETNDFKHDL